jgi:CMP-N-acetylneuraminic acid synthetase
MVKPITALIPCRKGSERVNSKNTKPFGDSSLFDIKIKQLLAVDLLDSIVVSTDDPVIIDRTSSFSDSRIVIIDRPHKYAHSLCSTDDLVKYVIDNIPFECLLWTHVTSPFFTEETYLRAISTYIKGLEHGYDSLIAAEVCREFVWNAERESVNYNRSEIGNWPRTQLVNPIYIINSGAFIAARDVMEQHMDRVGKNPLFFPTSKLEGFDIDWEEDFRLGEQLWISLNSVATHHDS